MSNDGLSRKLLSIAPLLALLALWQWAGSLSPRMTFLYGTPTTVILTLAQELGKAAFLEDVITTIAEVAGGLLFGSSIGTSIALLLWLFPRVGEIARPYAIAIGSIPIFAITPLIILWFGVGFAAKLAIIVFSTAFVALAYSLDAAFRVGRRFDEVIASCGGTRWDLLHKVVIPGTIARSFVAYKMNVSFALIGAYVAEWVSAKHGLGQFILRATTLYDIPRVWAGLVVFILIAFFLYALVGKLERRISPR